MKRLRLERWPGHLCSARPMACSSTTASTTTTTSTTSSIATASSRSISTPYHSPTQSPFRRYQSTGATARDPDAEATTTPAPSAESSLSLSSESPESPELESPPPEANQADVESWRATRQIPTSPFLSKNVPRLFQTKPKLGPIPSPLPSQALKSAKLAALHARLALSDKVPLQTLARTLVDTTADEAPLFNNANLAYLGQTLISYYLAEMLMCRYPRLPMEIMHTAMKSYAGDKTLYYVAKSWGVESAAAPGPEVDPGLLQFSLAKDRSFNSKWGFVRPTQVAHPEMRRGISSSVVLDDDFGDTIYQPKPSKREQQETPDLPLERQLALGDPDEKQTRSRNIHATFVRAVVGAIYTHSGREAARSFIKAHIQSRQLDLAQLFSFRYPQRELSRLCAREAFDAPVARLLSETGRLSSSPVFVVGVFSGNDKLGEGVASSLVQARQKAAINSLLAWYLYSPGEHVRVPSDMLQPDAKAWEPVYVDIGEIVSGGL